MFTREDLIAWIESIFEAAREDTSFSISWFRPTEKCPFSIIAGWGYLPDMPESFCVSKSSPKYCMCIKIAENEGPYAYTDYEIMTMPWNRETGDVDDTEVILEWDDPIDYMADHFMAEWMRLMDVEGEGV